MQLTTSFLPFYSAPYNNTTIAAETTVTITTTTTTTTTTTATNTSQSNVTDVSRAEDYNIINPETGDCSPFTGHYPEVCVQIYLSLRTGNVYSVDIAMVLLFVRPSVCPSQPGTELNPGKIQSPDFHHKMA